MALKVIPLPKYCLCELECRNGYLVSFRAAIIFSSLGLSWNRENQGRGQDEQDEIRRLEHCILWVGTALRF